MLDLPDKLITPVYLELQNTEGYKNVWNEYLSQRKKDGKKGNPGKDVSKPGWLGHISFL